MLSSFLDFWYTEKTHLSDFILQACSASDSNPSSRKFQPRFKFRGQYYKDVFGKDMSKIRPTLILMIARHWRYSESLIDLTDPIKLRETTTQ